MNLVNPKDRSITRGEYLDAANGLTSAPRGRAAHASMGLVFWSLLLLAAASGMAFLTAGLLGRLLSPVLAWLVAAFLHLSVGLSAHLIVVGKDREDALDLLWGRLGMGIGLTALGVLAVARAVILTAEGREPALAWGVSFFLFLLETGVPLVFGYLLARAWLAAEEARGEAVYYAAHHRKLQTGDAATKWSSAEGQLLREVEQHQRELAYKGEVAAHREERIISRLERRLAALIEWNPGRRLGDGDAPSTNGRTAGPSGYGPAGASTYKPSFAAPHLNGARGDDELVGSGHHE